MMALGLQFNVSNLANRIQGWPIAAHQVAEAQGERSSVIRGDIVAPRLMGDKMEEMEGNCMRFAADAREPSPVSLECRLV